MEIQSKYDYHGKRKYYFNFDFRVFKDISLPDAKSITEVNDERLNNKLREYL